MDLSLVIPCFNEGRNVAAFLLEATTCFDAEEMDYELIFVDDGSSDDTVDAVRDAITLYRRGDLAALQKIAYADTPDADVVSAEESADAVPRRTPLDVADRPTPSGRASFDLIELSRNFGKESALYAGLEHAKGTCVGFIDADLQQEPSVALKMYRILQHKPEVDSVAAAPAQRRESAPLRACKELFYRVFNGLSDTKLLSNVSDFRVFRRNVADTLLSLHEQYRFSKGLFSWAGFKTEVIEYDVQERHEGESRWTFRKLLSYAWNGVLAFSTCPLQMVTIVGVVLILASIAFLAGVAYASFVLHFALSLLLVVLGAVVCLGGIQLVALGVVGEYSARGYIEGKQRPVYVARRELAFPAEGSVRAPIKVVPGCRGGMPHLPHVATPLAAQAPSMRSERPNGTYGASKTPADLSHRPAFHVIEEDDPKRTLS